MKPEEAIKRIENLIKGRKDPRGKTELDFALDMAIEALKERPHGEWISHNDEFRKTCSCCGFNWKTVVEFNFCPDCGADMREEGEK